MGIITRLIDANQRKKATDINNEAFLYSNIWQMDDDQLLAAGKDPKVLKPWALDNLIKLYSKEGGKPAKETAGPLHGILSTLGTIKSGLSNLNPVPAAPKVPPQPAAATLSADEAQQQQSANRQREIQFEGQKAQAVKARTIEDLKAADTFRLQQEERERQRQIGELERMRGSLDPQEYKELNEQIRLGTKVQLPARLTAAARQPSVAEENRQEAHNAYALLIHKDPASLTPVEQQKADQWSKETALTKKRVDILQRQGVPFEQAWAQVNDDEVQEDKAKREKQTGTQETPEIKRGTPEFKVAQDVAYGRLPFNDFTRLYSYGRDVTKRVAIYNKATELNPNFNQANYERGFKFASNPQTQRQLGALDNVLANVDDFLALSDKASRTGVPLLNRYVVPGGAQIGSTRYSNFQAAREAFADELSGALGFGTATDKKLELAQRVTDPNLSPDGFRQVIEGVVKPFVMNKKQTMLDQMGIYGQPGMNPAADKQVQERGGNPDLVAKLPKPSTRGKRLSVEQTRQYFDAYGGDVDKARAAAKADGWTF